MTPPPVLQQETSAPQRAEPGTRWWWALAGVLTGAAGLSVGQLVSEVLSVRGTPLVTLAQKVAGITPGETAQATADFLATLATPLVLVVVAAVLGAVFAVGGLLWRRSVWAAMPVWVALAGGLLAAGVATNGGGRAQVLPVVAGFAVWVLLMSVLAARLRRLERELASASAREEPPHGVLAGRRNVLVGMGAVALVALVPGGASWWLERRRAAVRESRRLLRIPGVTRPRVPPSAVAGMEGLTPWQTRNDDFYVVNTGLRTPTMEASSWTLRIHGLVRTPLELTYDDLLRRDLAEAWVTLASADDEVGGKQVGNAWFSGVPVGVLLEEAGVLPEADAVLQTSVDGWSCATPLAALTDGRSAMLAVAMNGEALPLEHGFPVRTVVPGLYDHTASCPWVVDWEVTRFGDVTAYATERGWAEKAPVRLASRVDVPAGGESVEAGWVEVGGMAWHPGVGIDRVEFAVDGGRWNPATVHPSGTDETWVQWTGSVRLEPGEHAVRVRAVNALGEVQTPVLRDPAPSGPSGHHEVEFTVAEPETD